MTTGHHLLRYDAPAREWESALPLGNGRLGAMCFARPLRDRVQINDDTAWSGGAVGERPGDGPDREAAAALTERVRRLLLDGEFAAADEAARGLQSRYSQMYLPFADLHLDLVPDGGAAEPYVSGYARSLDLRDAVHEHSYLLGGRRLRQSAYVSAPAGVLVIEVESERSLRVEAALSTRLRHLRLDAEAERAVLRLRLPSDAAPSHEPEEAARRYDDDPRSSLQGAVVLGLRHDGEARSGAGAGPAAIGVRRLRLALATATTFAGLGREPLAAIDRPLAAARDRVAAALERDAAELRAEHVADHRSLYERVTIDLAPSRRAEAEAPTDARLARAAAAPEGALAADPDLAALLYRFGRYLLIASSRPGTTPTNLQGIWNDRDRPPWSSNYTVNINTQMNYWPVETANLAELHEPLFDLLEALVEHGAATAARLHGARGWAMHHNTDIWAHTPPVGLGHSDNAWAYWPMGGVWLATHLRHHLEFGAGEDFAERAWPIASGAARFLLDWLEAGPDGRLETPVSSSPENHFADPSGVPSALARGSEMDTALARELLAFVVELDGRLGIGSEVAAECAAALPRLRPMGVGADGRVLEWPHGLPDTEPHHRHVSHLYGLYPGGEPLGEELREAVRRSLEARGDDSTGWSLAWKICLWARLGDGERVGRLIDLFFREPQDGVAEWAGALYPNLFQSNPPFQIDANFGFVAAVNEALVQSHRGRIELLPALPAALADGSVRGLVARPGVVVDLDWRSGEPVAVTFTARSDTEVTAVYRERGERFRLERGVSVAADPRDWGPL